MKRRNWRHAAGKRRISAFFRMLAGSNSPATSALAHSISEMNLSNWFHGGYQDWCADRLPNLLGVNRSKSEQIWPAKGQKNIPQHPKPAGGSLPPESCTQLQQVAASRG
jgi:hypothetical protein